MYEKSTFTETLKTLEQRRVAYQEQIIAIQKFEILLSKLTAVPGIGIEKLPVWAQFEVHVQCYLPDQCPVTVTGRSLSRAYERAIAIWKERNGENCNPSCTSVFLSYGDMFLVISPVDAARIAGNERCRTFHPDLFTIGDCLLEKVGATVWPKGAQLPGWHSNKPIALEDEAKEPVPV